jgi:hypothetical protein
VIAHSVIKGLKNQRADSSTVVMHVNTMQRPVFGTRKWSLMDRRMSIVHAQLDRDERHQRQNATSFGSLNK